MRFTEILLIGVAFTGFGCVSGSTPGSEIGPGIHAGRTASFKAHHDFTVSIPKNAKHVELWFATPNPNDRMQQVSDFAVVTEHPYDFVTDDYGNRFLHMKLDGPMAGDFKVDTSFAITRHEMKADLDPKKTRPHTAAELTALARYLKASQQSVIDDDVRAMARQAVGDEKNPILASRKIYDAVLARVDYHVKDPKPDAQKDWNSTGTGSSKLCYASCKGNCTDFHSLYAAVSRAAGIPTRAVYGSLFKGPLDGTDKDQSYHCWIEFHAPNIGWIPLDAAIADIFEESFHANENSRPRANLTVADGYGGPDPRMVDYYFGNVDERRVTWHWGRDLMVGQRGAPLLWNPKAYAEVDGKPAGIVKRKLTYSSR